MSNHYKRLVNQLFPCDADDLVAAVPKHHVTRPVSLEGGSVAVEGETIDFHDQARLWPEKVDFESLDPYV